MRLNNMMRSIPPLWVLVLLAVVLWGGEFVRRGLWEPDEARYAYVAREMRADNHWFVPHINGILYPDKPPLMFWLINASSLLTGGHINGVSARLPSLLGSILTLWVVTHLLARWHSTEAAWRAMLILLTTFLFWQKGSWGQIDALLCGLVMMSSYFLFTSVEGCRGRREFLAYGFAGLAVLAKGPVGLMLPMGIFAVGMAATGESRKLQRSHWLWGPLLAAAIPAVWLLISWQQDAPADYFASMFGEKSFGRAIQAEGHAKPFYYFLWHFPLELLPWTIFLPAALTSFSNRGLRRRLVGWIVFVVGVFSLFVCKRNLYILAAYPAAAMLIGAAWDDISQLSYRWKVMTSGVAVGVIWLLALIATVAIFVPQIPFNRFMLIPSACVLLLGGLLVTRMTRREPLSLRWLLSFCCTFLLFQTTASAVVLPALNGLKGPIEAAEAAKAQLKPDQPVYLFCQQLAIFPLYAERPGKEVWSLEALKRVVASEPNAVVVLNDKQWHDVRPEFGESVKVQREFNMGHKRLVLIASTDESQP